MVYPKTYSITHLTYEKLFGDIQKGNLIIPISYLNEIKNIDDLISDIIKNFDSVEAIRYSSFLNAVTQTHNINENIALQSEEIKNIELTNTSYDKGILFHRDSLLYFISQVIVKDKNGTLDITGPGNASNSRDYYKSLLLINSKLNRSVINEKQTVLKDYFIREYPYYYDPEILYNTYSTRIQRYWYIYNHLLPDLDKQSKNNLCDIIKILEEKTQISLKDYFDVLEKVLEWFLGIPYARRYSNNKEFEALGFQYRALNTFYINKDNFKEDESFIKIIDHLSIDIKQMKQKFLNIERRDKIEGFYEYFQNFFDKPIFKIDEDDYCIIDLKFLFEGICSGFIWHLKDISQYEIKRIKDKYGYLLEEYFIFLLKKIFKDKNVIITNKDEGKPDAFLQFDDYIIIFEFTTEPYRFASLYNTEKKGFLDDLYRILFNEGEGDTRGRNKKDKGKFFKLNTYIEEQKNKGKKIIPVLITENYIGDYDLINEFYELDESSGFIEQKISNKNLDNLKEYKPLIINLDDLERFWAVSDSNKAEQEFIQYIEAWEKEEKNIFHYNFSLYMNNKSGNVVKNSRFKEFFDFYTNEAVTI